MIFWITCFFQVGHISQIILQRKRSSTSTVELPVFRDVLLLLLLFLNCFQFNDSNEEDRKELEGFALKMISRAKVFIMYDQNT